MENEIINFYNNTLNFNIFRKVLSKESKISLRFIEWFVSNYAQKNQIKYYIKRSDQTNVFEVHRSYRQHLRTFKKQYFDPFCRGKKIKITATDTKTNQLIVFETTLAQLNYFKWLIENFIIDYIEANYDTLQQAMKRHSKEKQLIKKMRVKSAASMSSAMP